MSFFGLETNQYLVLFFGDLFSNFGVTKKKNNNICLCYLFLALRFRKQIRERLLLETLFNLAARIP